MSEITIQIVAYRCEKCTKNLPCTLIVAGEIVGEPDVCPYEPSRYPIWKLLETTQ